MKIVFHELLLDLEQGYVVDLGIGIEPFKVSEDLVEGSSPVGRILQLILYLCDLLVINTSRPLLDIL